MQIRPPDRQPSGLVAATLLALGTVASCTSADILGPVEPDRVTITLGVTGGIASADYAFAVDGARGEVVGIRCAALCDFSPGEVLGIVSGAQIAYLAERLDRAGAIGLDGRDFGQGCCDFRHLELVYERGDRSARVTGTEDRLPDAIADAVRLLAPMADKALPAIIAPETTASDWPRDPYQLGEVTVEGSTLRAEVTYSGGCESHPMDLVLWGGWMESFPVQINALITHDDGNDPCDALVTEERAFDLYALARAYREAYGDPTGDPHRVILRLWDPEPGRPTRSIEVEL